MYDILLLFVPGITRLLIWVASTAVLVLDAFVVTGVIIQFSPEFVVTGVTKQTSRGFG